VTTNITWANPIALESATSILTDAGTTLTTNGTISGPVAATLEKNGTGTLILPVANSYLGATTLRQGLTVILNNTSLGGSGGTGTTVADGASLRLGAALTVTGEDLAISGGGVGGEGALQAITGINTWTGLVSLISETGGPAEADISVTGSASLTFTNVVSGNNDLRKIGTGTLRLTGTLANTYTGTTFIDEGTLALTKTAGINALSGPVIVGDGVGGNNADLLILESGSQIPDVQPVRVNASGLFNLNNQNEAINTLTLQAGEVSTGAGTLFLGGNVTTLVSTTAGDTTSVINGNLSLGAVARTFNVADDVSPIDLLVNAVISGGAGVGIVKTGPGQMALGGPNTYSGPTLVNAGTLVLAANNVLPDVSAVTLAPGTTLDVNGKTDLIAALTGSGTLALGTGLLVTSADNADATFAGPITGSGGLRKVGTGTLTLTGDSPAYTGTTTVVGGTVLVNANQSGAAVVVQNGGVLGGTGTVGPVTVEPGGAIAPGVGPGILNANGNVTFSAGSSFRVQANGPTVGTEHDRLAATGTVNLGGSTLSFTPGPAFARGDSVTIITAAAVTGTFNGLPDLGTFSSGNRFYQIDYTPTSVVVTLIAFVVNGSLTSNLNPSQPGQPVTFTATFAPAQPGDPTPTGQVEFFDGSTSLGLRTLASGSAALTTSALSIGTHSITATYFPDTPDYLTTTVVLSPPQVVNVASTTTLVALNSPARFGTPVTFVARVAPVPSLPTPTGAITFVDLTTGATLGVVGLDATGGAALTTAGLSAGTHTIQAVYTGDSFYRSSSATAVQVVTRLERIAVGTDAGTPSRVRVYEPLSGALIAVLDPFFGYTGGVKVAVGDVNGDGTSDIIVSAGRGAPGGHIMIFSGADYSVLASYFSFPGYAGGMNVAAGDVNGDGFADVIVSTSEATDHVKVFSSTSQTELMSFFAFGGGNPVGVTVGAGDVDGDGRADVITGSATFAGHVKVFQALSAQLIGSYFAYGAGYLGGIFVAGGDLDGDGRAEIITGATNAPHVKALTLAGQERASFFAYEGSPFGVRVGAVDRNGDALADIITGSGGAAPHVKVFSGLSLGLIDSFLALTPGDPAGSNVGIFVGGSDS
jgi:autotransporter-associated beta strand protein